MLPNHDTLISRLLFFTLLFASFLRFYELDRLGLWADELWVVMDSSAGSLWDMLLTVYYRDNHPPGYYLLSRYTQILLGSSDFAIRLPSAIAGILLVAATFIAGKKHLSPEAALIATVLVAGSYQAIYFSQEARANVFVALFSLLSLHYFRALALEQDNSRKNFVAFWLFSTLNAYFHYAGLVFTIGLFCVYLFILAGRRDKTCLISGFKIFFPLLLLYLPWVPGMIYDLVASPPESWQYSPTPQTLISTFIFLFGPGDLRIYGYGIALIGAPLWVAAIMLKPSWRDRYGNSAKVVVLIWFCMLLPLVFFYVKSIVSQSAYNRRHFLYAIPLLSLLLGLFLSRLIDLLSEKHRSKAIVILVALIFSYQLLSNNNYSLYSSNHFKQDYRESAQLVVDHIATLSGESVLIASNSRFFDHYLNHLSKGNLTHSLFLNDASGISEVSTLLADGVYEKFYYLEAPANPSAHKMVTKMDRLLAAKYAVICRSTFTRTQAILFDRNAPTINTTIDWESVPVCVIEK